VGSPRQSGSPLISEKDYIASFQTATELRRSIYQLLLLLAARRAKPVASISVAPLQTAKPFGLPQQRVATVAAGSARKPASPSFIYLHKQSILIRVFRVHSRL